MRNVFVLLSILHCLMVQSQTSKQISARGYREVITQTKTLKGSVEELWTEIEQFDKKGRLIVRTEYNPDSIEFKKQTIHYNNRGDKTEEVKFNSKTMEEFSKNTYTYDALGNLIGTVRSNRKGLVQSTEIEYNKHNEKIREKQFDKNGILMKQIDYLYDNQGLMIQRNVTDGSGAILEQRTIQYRKGE